MYLQRVRLPWSFPGSEAFIVIGWGCAGPGLFSDRGETAKQTSSFDMREFECTDSEFYEL